MRGDFVESASLKFITLLLLPKCTHRSNSNASVRLYVLFPKGSWQLLWICVQFVFVLNLFIMNTF